MIERVDDEIDDQYALWPWDRSIDPLLSGERFDNGIGIPILAGNRRPASRFDLLKKLVQGKQVLHVGCVDHLDVIEEKRRDGEWLHELLLKHTQRCAGLDYNADGIDRLRNQLGIQDVYHCDVIADQAPPEIARTHWDFMILGDILEHLDNPVDAVRGIRARYAHFVDTLLVSVPNALSGPLILSSLRGQELVNTDHRYWFTPYTLAKVLTRAGCRVLGHRFCQRRALTKLSWPKRLLLRQFPTMCTTLLMSASMGDSGANSN